MVKKNVDIVVRMVNMVSGSAKEIVTSSKKISAGIQQTAKTYDQFGKLISQKDTFKKYSESQRLAIAETKKFNKVGKTAGFGDVLRMNQQDFKKFNTQGHTFNKRSARMANGLRKVTHGLRGFRMEMLGVMFFGMAIQRMFMGLLKPALQMSGAMELLSTVLGLMFLPVGLALIDWIMKLWNWWDNASEATKVFWRSVVVAGVVLGTLIMVIGQLALGIGSIIMAFGGFIGWIFKIGMAILSFIGPWGLLIALLFGLAIPFASAGNAADEFGEKQKGVWATVKDFIVDKIQGIVGWMDLMWEKFLDWTPINEFLLMMGMSQEAIERLKNPLMEARNFIDTMWTKWIRDNPKVIKLASKLGLKVKDLEGPFAIIKELAREIWDQFKIYWAKLIELIENNEFVQSLIDKFDDLVIVLKDIVAVGAKLAASSLFKLLETLASFIVGAENIREKQAPIRKWELEQLPDWFTGGPNPGELEKIYTAQTPEGGFSTAFPENINIYLKMPDGTTTPADLVDDWEYGNPHPYQKE